MNTIFMAITSREVQLSTCLHIATVKNEDGTAKVRSYNAKNIDLGYTCFQEKYYRVARAAVNESV